MRYDKVALLLAALYASNSFAAQRTFVSAATGADINPCTRPLPCRSFAAALPATDAGGEIIAVDSGGYGPVTIAQAVSIIAPAGVHAAITATSANAITVAAADTDNVLLSNLIIGSIGANDGVVASSVAQLSVEHCTISGFGDEGLRFQPSTALSRLLVTDTTVRNSGVGGIHVIGAADRDIRATIESAGLYDNTATNLAVAFAHATIRNSVAAGTPVNPSVWAQDGGIIIADRTVSAMSLNGFFAQDSGVAILTRCVATGNTAGLAASGTIYVSDSTITMNSHGVDLSAGGSILTRNNNRLQRNTVDGAFTAAFSGQ